MKTRIESLEQAEGALLSAFEWAESKQGLHYWVEVHYNLLQILQEAREESGE